MGGFSTGASPAVMQALAGGNFGGAKMQRDDGAGEGRAGYQYHAFGQPMGGASPTILTKGFPGVGKLLGGAVAKLGT